MNFASLEFALLFLPAVLAGFFLIRGPRQMRTRQAWLIAASLLFYGWSGAANLALLAVSGSVNFSAGRALASLPKTHRLRSSLMWLAVAANVGALLVYKLLALDAPAEDGFLAGPRILIPLALSFITFQQIGFVVACYRGRIRCPTWFDYLFFLTFFPQLIMGPIVQYDHVSGQLGNGALAKPGSREVAIGLSIFIFGLAKKVLLADQLAIPVDRLFDLAQAGAPLTTSDAWFAAIGFQLQLFLDFSAYAEMSIGLARMFGIILPINFDEPLKAVDRFDLWRRWHITFVMFMRTHVFFPLVRHWKLPAVAAIVVTALLSGLWHGLGWTFILWGFIQAAILLVLHWRQQRRRRTEPPSGWRLVRAIAATFLITCLVGAMFRAPTLAAAGSVYGGLLGFGAGSFAPLPWRDLAVFLAAAAAIWAMPSAPRFFGSHWVAHDPRPEGARPTPRELVPLRFVLNRRWAAAMALLVVLCFFYLGEAQRFVYVQF